MSDIVAKILTDVSSSFSVPVCYTLEEWDVRSTVVRTDEVGPRPFTIHTLINTLNPSLQLVIGSQMSCDTRMTMRSMAWAIMRAALME
jgi:hypothetical protein